MTDEPNPSRSGNRRARGYALEFFVLLGLGTMLLATNARVTFIDDEVSFLNGAVAPVSRIFGTIWKSSASVDHPPLGDIILHCWLNLTGGAFDWLRVPSILFYLGGLFLLSRAAKRLAGDDAARITIWLGALWPYGFHYGRMATASPLGFLLIAAVTFCYLGYVEDPTLMRAAGVILLLIALVWTTFSGWPIGACLAIDFVQRRCRTERRTIQPLAIAFVILAASYIPLWRAFCRALMAAPNFPHSVLTIPLNAAFNVYAAFVSESVAPWFWQLGIPAAICVACCIIVVTRYVPEAARRLWFYAFALLALMAVAGILNARHLLDLSAWLLLAVSVTLATIPRGVWRRVLLASLAGIVFVGWLGIIEPTHYAAPRLIEPWKQVADEAATRARLGQTVIGNNPSFFFYLTYAMPAPEQSAHWRFLGVLPETVTYPGVYEAETWLLVHRSDPYVYFVRGAPGPDQEGPAWVAEQKLRASCLMENEQLILPDPAAALKARFYNAFSGMRWRIRVLEFHCPSATSAR